MPDRVYADRRRRVLEGVAPGVLVLPAAPLALRNNDVEHEYRQDSDLYYLTGFDEPETVAVLRPDAEKPFTLFVRPRDPEREVWDGARAGCEGAVERFGADAAYPISELDQKLVDALEGCPRLFYRMGRDRAFDDRVLRALDGARARARRGSSYPTAVVDPATVLHEMRRLKSADEVELMAKAAAITRDAHLAAMRAARPGMFEYELEALLRATFRRAGSERPAYAPIVGSGPNATVLHYRRNDRRMCEGDLLLIDAGCEYGYYASDVTRTFPVGGRFSAPQRRLFDLVLSAQTAGIDAVRPGVTLDDIHQRTLRILTEGMIDLGLVEGPFEEAIKEERYKRCYMHKTSHYLGMDVHDVGAYFIDKKPRPLEAGVVITVEPGLYVAPDDTKAPSEYRGIGIRIEDDILVTADGHRVLSDGLPRTASEIELLCSS